MRQLSEMRQLTYRNDCACQPHNSYTYEQPEKAYLGQKLKFHLRNDKTHLFLLTQVLYLSGRVIAKNLRENSLTIVLLSLPRRIPQFKFYIVLFCLLTLPPGTNVHG